MYMLAYALFFVHKVQRGGEGLGKSLNIKNNISDQGVQALTWDIGNYGTVYIQ